VSVYIVLLLFSTLISIKKCLFYFTYLLYCIYLFAQVKKNQDDINDLQQNGGGTIPPGLENQVTENKDNIAFLQKQINQHNFRLDDLESDVSCNYPVSMSLSG